MMLWYKAWRESRPRFLMVAGAIVVFALGFLVRARIDFPLAQNVRVPYTAFVWSAFYGQQAPAVFSIVALIFGLGGLQRERRAGSASFTLALPVSRAQLVGTRACVGLIELTALAAIPAIIVPTLSPLVARQTYPASQSLSYAALFLSWGVVWFGLGFVWSSLFAGEYSAAVASVLSPFAYMVVYSNVSEGGRRFLAANPFFFMSGGLDAESNGRALLMGPLPWIPMAVLMIVAVVLILAASRATVRQNF